MVLFFFCSASIWPTPAKNPPLSFRILQYQCLALGWADLAITSMALSTGNFQEKNPIARTYINQPAVAITVHIAGEGTIFWGTTRLWQVNKPLAWGLLILFTGARAYVLAKNIKTIKEYYQR